MYLDCHYIYPDDLVVAVIVNFFDNLWIDALEAYIYIKTLHSWSTNIPSRNLGQGGGPLRLTIQILITRVNNLEVTNEV